MSIPLVVPALSAETHASAIDLIKHFPLPCFILGPAGDLIFQNTLAERRLALPWLRSSATRFQILGTGAQTAMMEIPDADGTPRQGLAYATPLADLTVVVLDDRAAERGGEQAAALQRRIFELEQLSTTDPLTRLSNRRHFDTLVLRELAFSERDRSPLTLLLLDLDHFKLINDRFGHAVGDAVLRDTASRLRAAARTTDTVFRWGGEEFAVLAPATSATAGAAMGERMRASIAGHAFEGAGRCTISVGVAEHVVAEPPERWFARLDAALYQAKEGGRDRVIRAAGGASEVWLCEKSAQTLRLVWSSYCESGHPLIDEEHRGLFDAANAVMAAMGECTPAAIAEQVDQIVALVAAHFEHEEQVLERVRYPRLEEHRGLHAKLLADARRLSAELHAGSGSTGEVVEFLAYEVVNRHLLKADRHFFPWLHADAPADQGSPV